MGVTVLEVDRDVTVETVGAVISHPYFIHTFLIMLTSVLMLLMMSLGNYWPTICQKPDIALFGLIGGLYTLTITGTALVLSMILVDDCSWFFKFFVLFSSSTLYVCCGMYYLYGYFHSKTCASDIKNFYSSNITRFAYPIPQNPLLLSLLYSAGDENTYHNIYNCYQQGTLQEHSTWTPLLIFVCILAGVVYFLFAVSLVLTFDTK